eukprot:6209031-Pleurochrysis_carterae.AAC.2
MLTEYALSFALLLCLSVLFLQLWQAAHWAGEGEIGGADGASASRARAYARLTELRDYFWEWTTEMVSSSAGEELANRRARFCALADRLIAQQIIEFYFIRLSRRAKAVLKPWSRAAKTLFVRPL